MGPWESLPRCSKIHKKCAIKKFVKSFFTKKIYHFTRPFILFSIIHFHYLFLSTLFIALFFDFWSTVESYMG